ncbi:hypothetical protein BD309DRAFT_979518 [Dichomitus squalens]|nr:hypothetical protein BD309DRAFT_979518 [Dichomitus squalens]
MAILFVIAYVFVKSFSGQNCKQSPSPLIRLGSLMAFLGHTLGIIGMIAFSEFFTSDFFYVLYWVRSSKQIRAPLYSVKQKRQRMWIVIKYGVIYVLGPAVFRAWLALPLAFRDHTISRSICQDI